MAVKARSRKRLKMKELVEKSVKIKCCYCDLYETCKTKSLKEKSEELGIATHCTMTPNIPKKKLKKIIKK